jgi:hypothetical protein
MKKYITLILIEILIFGCSDGDNSTNDQLIGKWNWMESSGGIAYHTETPESTGKTVKLEIDNNTIKRFVNGALDYESNYSIEFINDNGQQLQIITIMNQTIPLQIIDQTKNTLKLREYNVSDGFDITYTRK